MEQSVIVKEEFKNPEISIMHYKDLFSPLPLEQMFNSSFESGTQKPAEFDVSVIIQDKSEGAIPVHLVKPSTAPNSLVIDTPAGSQKVHKVYRNSSYDTVTRSRLSQLVTELDKLDDSESEGEVDIETPIKKLKLNDSYQSLGGKPHYSFHFAHAKSSSAELVQVVSDDIASDAMKGAGSVSLSSIVIHELADETVGDIQEVEAKTSGTYATAQQQQPFMSSMKVQELEQEVTDSLSFVDNQRGSYDDTLSTQQLLAFQLPKNKIPSPDINVTVSEELPRCATDEFDEELNKQIDAFRQTNRNLNVSSTTGMQTPQSPSKQLLIDPFEDQLEDVPQKRSPLKIPRRESIPEPTIRRQPVRLSIVPVSCKSVTDVPSPPSVQHLQLSNFEKLDAKIICFQFVNLITLDLSNTKISSIDFLQSLPQLRHLYVQNNRIRHVDSILQNANLDTLDVTGNLIHKLSCHSKAIQCLLLNNNPLETLTLDTQQIIKLSALKCPIKQLLMKNCKKLKQLFVSQAHLDLSSIQHLHDTLSNMPLITNLVLSDCQLAVLPPALKLMAHIQQLDLSKNLISNLRSLKTVTSLQLSSLDLSCNQLVDLAHTLHYVSKLRLKSLSLHGNKFSSSFTVSNGLVQPNDRVLLDHNYPFSRIEQKDSVHIHCKVDDLTFVKYILYVHAVLAKLPNIVDLDGCFITEAFKLRNHRQYLHVKKFLNKQ